MFRVWRRFIVWLRTLLLKLNRKEKIEWDKEVVEVIDIIDDATKPEVPNYDIIGPVPRKRIIFRWLRRKK